MCEVQEVTRSALRPVQQGRRIENEMKKSPLYVPERRGGGEDLCEVQEVIELWEVWEMEG